MSEMTEPCIVKPYKGFLTSTCIFCGAKREEGFTCDLIGAQDDPDNTAINPDAKGFVLCRDVCGSPECRKYACSLGEVRLHLLYPMWSWSQFDLEGARKVSPYLNGKINANTVYVEEIKRGNYDFLCGLRGKK